MATYFLINSVTMTDGTKLMPGRQVSDGVDNVAAIQSAGGELVLSTTPGVSAAAAKAIAAHTQRGANEAACEAIMRTAIENEQSYEGGRKTTAYLAGAMLPAKGVNVHAQFAAGAAINATTAFTLPFPRRNLEIVAGAAAVATVFTLKGTRVDGTAFTLTKAIAGTGTVEIGDGAQPPETITSFTSDVDPGDTIDLKTADGFSVGEQFKGTPTVSVDGVVDGSATVNADWGGVKSSTNPNGTHAYAVRYDTGNQ